MPKSIGAKLNSILQKLRQYKGLVENFSYLSLIQVVNLLVSLLVVGYLIRVLGKNTYGLVVFAQSTIFFLVIIVSFGFQVTATKKISEHRDNKDKLNEIFSSVMIIKGLLFVVSCAILVGLTYLIPKARADKLLFYLSMSTAFYEFIFPSWYFQGIEKMSYSAIATVILKLTFFVLIFILIKEPSDYYLVPVFNGVGSILAAIICLYLVFVKEKVRFSFQPIVTLKYYFNDSLAIFITNSASMFYANANKFLIGLISKGNEAVALYDVAEKVVTAMKLPHTILNQAVFPRISKEKNINFTKRLFYYLGGAEIILFTMLFVLAPFFVVVIGGQEAAEAGNFLRLLAITVPLNALSSYVGIQYLVVHGYKKLYSKLVVICVAGYIVAGIGLQVTGLISVNTLIYITIATEVLAFALMLFYTRKKKLAWAK